ADYYKRTNEGGFTQKDYHEISSTEEQKTLLQLVNDWLERMPFFDERFWPYQHATDFTDHAFWQDYRTIYKNGLTEREA
ncbi:hypothetical protein ABTM92_20210, partial [Acinetobacter baumannii]